MLKIFKLVQNRENGEQDFYQDFDAYVDGFGNLEGEFWMGKNIVLQ